MKRVFAPASRLVLLATLLLLQAVSVESQYIERMDVEVANVDVVVTDRAGKPVRGLTVNDFEVFEDGVRQTITNFSAFDVAAPPQAAATADAPVRPEKSLRPPPRLIVIFLDIDDIEPVRRKQFFAALGTFLESAVHEGDRVTVLNWNRRIRVVLPPTADRTQVASTIDLFARAERWSEAEIMRRAAELRVLEAEADAAFAQASGARGGVIDPEAEAEFQEWLIGEQRCEAIRRKANELRNLIGSISRVETRSLLILASDDFSLNPTRNCYTERQIDALADSANAYGVTIHAFHPPGQRDRMIIGPDRGGFLPKTRDQPQGAIETSRTFDQAGGLLRVADRTGGIAAVGPGHSARALAQAAAELETYYSIGYRFSGGTEDRPRRVKVRTKNRAYRVRSRETVTRLSEPARLRDELTASLYLPARDLPQSPAFDVKIDRMTREGRFALVHLEVWIAARDLVVLPAANGKPRGSYSLFVVGGRELGDASEVAELKRDFDEVPGAADSARHHATFAAKIRPDTTRLAIAVRDNVSGSVATKVLTIPAAGRTGKRVAASPR